MSSTKSNGPSGRRRRERYAFTLSLRADDEFEARLGKALKRLPYGYAKLFLARVSRLFGRNARNVDELYDLMLDFVVDVQPLCLTSMPEVRRPEVVQAMREVDEAARRYIDPATPQVAREALEAIYGISNEAPDEAPDPPPPPAAPAEVQQTLPLAEAAPPRPRPSRPNSDRLAVDLMRS